MPNPFFAAGSETSEAAADRLQTRLRDAQTILAFAVQQGENGLTCDEAEAALGLCHQSASARVHELGEQAQVLIRAGCKRNTRRHRAAEVYRLPENTTVEQALGRFSEWCTSSRRRSARTPAERGLLVAARSWVEAHGKESEQAFFEAFLDAAWGTYGTGSRPRPWQDDE